MFIQLLSASAAALGLTETSLYDGLLDQWWGKVRSHRIDVESY